jgi:ribose transport system substrate-binding protein
MSPRASSAPIRVGVVEKNQGAYWDMVNTGWEDAADALGLTVEIAAPVHENLETQLQLMRDLVDSGVDALVFVATDPTAFDEVVADAQSKGVVVMTFDLDALNSGRTLFVGMPSGEQMGRSVGELMRGFVGRGEKVIAQTGSTTAQGAMGKLRGFLEVMAEAGIECIVTESDGEDLDRASGIARDALAAHPDAKGMFGVYGYHPAIQADEIARVGAADRISVVGFDMVPETVAALLAGRVKASVWIREYYFGYLAAVAAHDLVTLANDDVLALYGMDPADPATTVRVLPVTAYTPDNVDEFVTWSSKRLGRALRPVSAATAAR